MIRISNIKVPIDNKEDLLDIIAKYMHINKDKIITYKINKKSIDARKKSNFCYVYEFDVLVTQEKKLLQKSKLFNKTPNEKYVFPKTGNNKLKHRPIIIGAGPAGLFCAYMLAINGYKPIIYERGKCIEERIKDVETFWQNGLLNLNSNVQFGEGGAGTFSDGKLNTLVKDKNFRMKKVFEIFTECGAPAEIMYDNKPHIGTDKLRNVVINLRNKIIKYGGEIHFNSFCQDIHVLKNKIVSVVINNQEIKTDILVLAIGHSARETFKMLLKKNISMEAKSFAVGIRIVHPQKMIDENQYPICYKWLPKSSYKLTYTNVDGRGVYTFCMCPGGYVVDASSNLGYLVINGMSNYKRDSGFANSALIVTVNKNDFGNDTLAGLNYIENIEQKAYKLAKGKIPIQNCLDYINNITSKNIKLQDFVRGQKTFVDINSIFPNYINEALKNGINYFNTKIPNFKNGIILAPETRTSSPIRIIRDDNLESNIKGIFPCGEGSGYAGGITTSAIDGIKVSEEIAKIYSNML